MAEGTYIRLLTSSIRHTAGSLFQQVVIQLDYPVAKGEAFGLDRISDLGHNDVRCLMYDV